MKIIVCSDSHGAFTAGEQVLEREKDAVAIIFLGDGAEEWSDLHEIYPQLPFYAVRGNCDWGSDWAAERAPDFLYPWTSVWGKNGGHRTAGEARRRGKL